ncbi:MAG: carbohydrate transporter rane protein 1, family [Caproiciproducens sp.]|nr:carbohydrate transporter rane protein 1, family [Caproiciproducens sp.]
MTENTANTAVKSKKSGKVNYAKYGYRFIAPFFIVYAIFSLYPLFYTIFLSFNKYIKPVAKKVIGPNFIGLENYSAAFTNETMMGSFRNTLIMWTINFIPQLLLALLLAAWLTDTRMKIRGQGAYKVLIFMPNIITAASISILFYSLFAFPQGPVNSILASLGLVDKAYFQPGMAQTVAHDFLNDGWAVRLIVAFINFWMWYGNTMIVLIAGILGINPALFESAQIDGASSGQIFRKITLPLMKPMLLYTLVTSLIGGMQMYDIPNLMLKQGSAGKSMIRTVTMYIFEMAFTGTRDYGRAATLSVMLFVFTAILSCILFYIMRDKDAIKQDKLNKIAVKRAKGGAVR